MLTRLLAPLVDQRLVENATISATEAQAEAFWRIRDSLSEAERAAFGPATQHDISVAVENMPLFMAEAAAEVLGSPVREVVRRIEPMFRRLLPPDIVLSVQSTDDGCAVRADASHIDQLVNTLADSVKAHA